MLFSILSKKKFYYFINQKCKLQINFTNKIYLVILNFFTMVSIFQVVEKYSNLI